MTGVPVLAARYDMEAKFDGVLEAGIFAEKGITGHQKVIAFSSSSLSLTPRSLSQGIRAVVVSF